MLEGIRKRTKSVYILLIFGAIIIVFVFWGVDPGGDGGREGNVVAMVGSDPILLKDYKETYKRQVEYYKNVFKEKFNDEMAMRLNLRYSSLDILINRTLAVRDAEAEGIGASAEEVRELVARMPAFSVDGVFNEERYFRVLETNRMDPAGFEKAIGYDIITSKMRKKVTAEVTVAETEVRDAYFRENRRINLEYITVDSAGFSGTVEIKEDEARAYLADNSSGFVVPLKMKAFYAHAGFGDFEAGVEVSGDEVREYYEKNPAQFERPAEVRSSHILISPDPDARDREEAGQLAMSKAEEVLERVRRGEPFKQLAIRFSQDPGSAAKGGDLGWFQRGVMLRPFEDAAFSLSVGEVSKVVKTSFGYHIIKLEEKREAGLVPLKKVAASIKARLKGEKAREEAGTLMEGLQGPFISAKSVEELEKAVGEVPGISFTLTPGFHEDDTKVFLARDPRLRDIVFTMNEGDVTRPVEIAEGFYIIKILERVEPHVPEYSLVSAKVKERLGALKSRAMAGKSADEFLKKLKGGEGFAPLAGAEGLKVDRTGFFSMAGGFVPGIGALIGEHKGLFDLSELVPYYPNVISMKSKFYVLKLKGVKEAGEKGFARAREEMRGRLQIMKEDEAVNEWLLGLRAKTEIKVFEERL